MPSITGQSTSTISRPNLVKHDSVNQMNPMTSSLLSVNPLGNEGKTPVNTEGNTGYNPLAMLKNELHGLNKNKQTTRLIQLFNDSKSPDAKEITAEMIKSVLNSDGMGDLNQQSLNYRPETSLIILTLLGKGEMNDELLDSAAKMIKEMHSSSGQTDKKIIKGALTKFDKEIENVMSKIEGDNFPTMVERFKKEYVIPEFENKLAPHLSERDIKKLSIKDCLVSAEYQKKAARIEELKQAYQKEGKLPSVDKSFSLHEAFGVLEELLEIPKTLKVTVDWEDRLKPKEPENTPDNKILSADEVDGFPHQPKASSAGNISNSYNTTTINNFYGSSFPESIKQVSQQESTVNQEQEQDVRSSNENVKVNLFGNNELSLPRVIKLPSVVLETPIKEFLPDYDLSNHSAQNDQEIDTVKAQYFIEPSNVSGPWKPSSTQEEKIAQSIKDRFQAASEAFGLAQENNQTMDNIKPKMVSHDGKYFIDTKVPKGVKLINNRELVKDKSPEETKYLEIKNASHYRASYINTDAKVVLSAEGLMTRNLSEKLAYNLQKGIR